MHASNNNNNNNNSNNDNDLRICRAMPKSSLQLVKLLTYYKYLTRHPCTPKDQLIYSYYDNKDIKENPNLKPKATTTKHDHSDHNDEKSRQHR